MTEYIVYGQAPQGSQIKYGRQQVKARFRDTTLMFAVDQMIDRIVQRMNCTFAQLIRIMPLPDFKSFNQFDNFNKLVTQVSKFATTYIDEAILSRAYQHREANIWSVAEDGIILYAQSWKPVLANAAALTILNYLEMIVVLMVLGIPAIILGAMIPVTAIRTLLGVLVLVGVWMFKLAISDAYAMAVTLLAYHRSIEGIEPNPDWKERLAGVSKEFRQLYDRSASAVSGEEMPPSSPSPDSIP